MTGRLAGLKTRCSQKTEGDRRGDGPGEHPQVDGQAVCGAGFMEE